MDIKKALIKTLRAEVKPAIGCTEPVAIALAVARAREAAEIADSSQITQIQVNLSSNVFKNAMGVGIPGTKMSGIDVAIALGAVACKSTDGLTVFSKVCEKGLKEALALMGRGVIRAQAVRTESPMYVEARICAGEKYGIATLIGKHDNFTHIENHDGVLYHDDFVAAAAMAHDLDGYGIAEIVRGIEELPYDEIAFLKDGVDMNLEMADYGLENECGLRVGKKLRDSGEFTECYVKNAMMLTAAAADARMDGAPLPVMSSSGSGNNGLTSIIPVAVYCQRNDIDDERMCRAIALSHITNTIIKQKIGRLSALCGCAISAGSGAAAALSWLKGGDIHQVEGTIQNMIANTSGMICDGAKTGCSLKLATSVSAAFLSSTLAMEGISVSAGNGIIGNQAEESISNLGFFADSTKGAMDESILDIMQRTNNSKR